MHGTQKIILVVDDDIVILETITDFLRLNGYEVFSASNGNQALHLMQNHTPDLVLSDITMPEVDGYQLYEHIRLNPAWGTIPFIFMSARGEQYDIRLGYGMGADAYLIKPFELEDLQIAVQSRLRRVQEIEQSARGDLEQMKNQMMMVMGHEMRTPLTYLYGYLGLIRSESDNLSQEELNEMLDGMERGTRRLMRVVEDLLLLTRIENQAVDFEIKRYRSEAPLAPLIDEVAAAHHDRAEAKKVQIEVHVPDSLSAYCLPNYLSDAVGRLLDNAIKFSKIQGGQVVISADQVDGQVVISVADTGIGVDPSQQGRLFQRFEQINREKMEQQGLGMGLAIAAGLVQAHNGSISVESVPNEGSVFIIALPVEG
jgi:two-component system, sensor histidine kinase and response regulator